MAEGYPGGSLTSQVDALVRESLGSQLGPLVTQLQPLVDQLSAQRTTGGGLDGGITSAADLANVATVTPTGGPSGSTEAPPQGSTEPHAVGTTPSDRTDNPLPREPRVHFGDGLPPIPSKLAAKMERGEFIDMHELLPECLSSYTDELKPAPKAKAKKRTQERHAWLQCFALYVGVVAPKKLHLVPEQMAYMRKIIRASQEYEGPAWAAYDVAYRRQAASTGHWQWSHVDPSLYTVCFTGKVRKITRCDRCLSATHMSEDCTLPSEEDPEIGKRLKAIESAVVALTRGCTPSASRGRSGEICWNFNKGLCRFPGCKHDHRCSICQGDHMAIACPSKGNRAVWGGGGKFNHPRAYPTSSTQRAPQTDQPY